MTTYEVTVRREGGLWAVVIDGLPSHAIGAVDVDRFADLDAEVRELIADLTDTDPSSFNLCWQYVIGDEDVTIEVTRLRHAEQALSQATDERDDARRAAIEALTRAEVSQAVIGDVLGLSHQRVHQLLRAG
jgi:DNA-directed RNA polymerase specialized sigma24 family protein